MTHRPERELWIDVARGIAILAVILSHVMFIRLQFLGDLAGAHIAFAVPWFIFLAGVTGVLSGAKYSYMTYWGKKLPLVGMYILASVISTFFSYHPFTLPNIFWPIVLFNASPPYYFFSVLFQLYLLFPLFWEMLKRVTNSMQFILQFALILIIGWYFSRITYAPWFYAHWNMLFGGFYAPVFFLGMAYGRWQKYVSSYIKYPAVVIFLIIEVMVIRTNGAFINITNAPFIPLFCWSLGLLIMIQLAVEALPRCTKLWHALAFFGRHSLPIFLFHYVIIDIFAAYLPGNWIYFLFLIVLGTGTPLLVEYIYVSTIRTLMHVRVRSLVLGK